MMKMGRRTNRDVIKDILLSADEPLSTHDIVELWPTTGGLSIGSVAQFLSRMPDVKKVGQKTTASITNDSYPVDTWTHINHERYAEWVDESTNE